MTRRRFISIIEPGLGWLLKDDFIDLRAAGAVDGTPATPGPGTRVVGADTGANLSIADGNLIGVGIAGGDPRMNYGTLPRIPGRVLIAHWLPKETAGSNSSIGWGQTDSNLDNAFQTSASILRTRNNNSITIDIGFTFTNNIPFYIAIVLRSTGAYYFIKETNWRLVWIDSTGSDATPHIIYYWQTLNFNSSFIHIPRQTFLPKPLAYDTFTRADGAIGSTETSGPDSQQVSAKAWTSNLGTTQIASNKLSTSALSGGKAIATIEGDNAEVLASIDLVRGSATGGLIFNYADASNYCYAEHDGTNYTVVKVVATTPTTLIDTAATYSSGAACQIHTYISGGALKVRAYYNNAHIGTEQSISDAALIAATKHGWYATDTDSTGDNFTLFARGQNDASYDFLNRFIK